MGLAGSLHLFTHHGAALLLAQYPGFMMFIVALPLVTEQRYALLGKLPGPFGCGAFEGGSHQPMEQPCPMAQFIWIM